MWFERYLVQRASKSFWPRRASRRTCYKLLCVRASSTEAKEPSDDEINEMPPYDKIDWVQTMIARKKGVDVLADPIFNKGTAFSTTERERLGIRGLLPPKVSNLTEQKKNILRDYYEGLEYVGPEDLESWQISSCAPYSCFLYNLSPLAAPLLLSRGIVAACHVGYILYGVGVVLWAC
jgi:hypothetical protein